MTGQVYHRNYQDKTWDNALAPTDCICSVKNTGDYSTFVGICVKVNPDENTIKFATHGDFFFTVDDSSLYRIGDTVLFDGMILSPDIPITNKIRKSIVGEVTAKIDSTTLAVFKA